LLYRVLAAVPDAVPRVVVGPRQPVPTDVLITREEPPGSGPVAATAAGIRLITGEGPGASEESGCRSSHAPYVALLAADLPFVTSQAVERLRRVAATPGVDGAVYVDDTGQRQLLCGVWRTESLRSALARFETHAGVSMRRLTADLRVVEVVWVQPDPIGGSRDTAAPPWYDCDTREDLRRAEERST